MEVVATVVTEHEIFIEISCRFVPHVHSVSQSPLDYDEPPPLQNLW